VGWDDSTFFNIAANLPFTFWHDRSLLKIGTRASNARPEGLDPLNVVLPSVYGKDHVSTPHEQILVDGDIFGRSFP
jgi:hypothetical protein